MIYLLPFTLENLKNIEPVPNVHSENIIDNDIKSSLIQKSSKLEEFYDNWIIIIIAE